LSATPAEVIASDKLLGQVLGLPETSEFWFGLKVQVFNGKMRTYRLGLGLTQQQLADKIGVSMPNISQVETFRRFPSRDMAEKIAAALMTTPEDLFPDWLEFYVTDISTHEFTSTSAEIKKAFARSSLGTLEPVLQPFIDPEPTSDLVAEMNERSWVVDQTLDSLTKRERLVLELRFGLNGQQSHTLDQTGELLGVNKERVRQIEAKTLSKLRHPAKSRILREHLPPELGERLISLPVEMDDKTKAALKFAGIRFVQRNHHGSEREALRPAGWTKTTRYPMLVKDEKDRPRFQILVVPYRLEVIPRFSVEIVHQQSTRSVFAEILDAGRVLIATEPISWDVEDCEEQTRSEAEEWLGYRFPAWKNPIAYWD
jgi:RNA polymerase sigma factor (sigma-70 family)